MPRTVRTAKFVGYFVLKYFVGGGGGGGTWGDGPTPPPPPPKTFIGVSGGFKGILIWSGII